MLLYLINWFILEHLIINYKMFAPIPPKSMIKINRTLLILHSLSDASSGCNFEKLAINQWALSESYPTWLDCLISLHYFLPGGVVM